MINASILLEKAKKIKFWNMGVPPHPFDKEWFIAKTSYGDKVVLKALPEEFSYDFKTADETYIMKDKIEKWAQFPDSLYINNYDKTIAILEAAVKIIEVQAEALEFYAKNQGLYIDHTKNVFKSSDCEDGIDFHGALAREAQAKVQEILGGIE